MTRAALPSATSSSSIADILERVLDKGVVIAGDIRVKLVDIELLTIQIRLVVCSIEKAKEIGMDWWNVKLQKETPSALAGIGEQAAMLASRLESIEEKLDNIDRVALQRGGVDERA